MANMNHMFTCPTNIFRKGFDMSIIFRKGFDMSMKRMFGILLLWLLLVGCAFSSEQVASQGWTYSDGTLTIYTDEAFSSVDLSPENKVQRLCIEEGVTVWREMAQVDLSDLKEIRLPSSLKRIERYAGYKILIPMIIPLNVETIEPFALPRSLDLVTISNENPYLLLIDGFLIKREAGMLIQCDERYYNTVETLIIPEGVKIIGEDAISEMPGIKTIQLPNTIERICRSGIVELDNLESISLPGSLKYIEDEAFCSCDKLLSLTLPNGICFDMHSDEDYVFYQSVKRLVFEGDFYYSYTPFSHAWQIEQIMFLGEKPSAIDLERVFSTIEHGTVYYLKDNISTWAIDGETTLCGMPLIMIDSIDDLPPIE